MRFSAYPAGQSITAARGRLLFCEEASSVQAGLDSLHKYNYQGPLQALPGTLRVAYGFPAAACRRVLMKRSCRRFCHSAQRFAQGCAEIYDNFQLRFRFSLGSILAC